MGYLYVIMWYEFLSLAFSIERVRYRTHHPLPQIISYCHLQFKSILSGTRVRLSYCRSSFAKHTQIKQLLLKAKATRQIPQANKNFYLLSYMWINLKVLQTWMKWSQIRWLVASLVQDVTFGRLMEKGTCTFSDHHLQWHDIMTYYKLPTWRNY